MTMVKPKLFKAGALLQNTADLDALYLQSAQANPYFSSFARALATEVGGEFVPVDQKNRETAERKIADEYKGNVRRLTDISRGAVLIDTAGQIVALRRIFAASGSSTFLKAQIDQGFVPLKLKDHFASPTESGYRVMNIKLRVPLADGESHICELQIQHRGMKEAELQTHDIYKQSRSITRQFRTASLNETESASYTSLEAQRRAIHDAAAARLGLNALERRL